MKLKSIFLSLLTLTACSTDLIENDAPQKVTEGVIMTAKDFEPDSPSRTKLDITDRGAVFSWAENDTVGVFPNEGGQVSFPIVEGAGTKTASFNGGGWALKPSSTYAAYYPMKGQFYLDKKAIPLTYVGQTQVGNASTTHLGRYDYMVAKAVTPSEGKANFTFEHLGCLIALDLVVPKSMNITSVGLSVSEVQFITKGEVNLTAEIPSIKPVSTSNSICVKVENVCTTVENEMVTIFFMMPPVDLNGKSIEINVGEYKGVVKGKQFFAGKAYRLSVQLENPSEGPSTVEWVDLGLPSGIKWASHNVGATKPEEYGDYYAWGDLTSITSSIQYVNQSKVDKMPYVINSLGWGDAVRVPTKYDIEELNQNCYWEWASYGCRYISKKNGKNLFFPAAGYYEGRQLIDAGHIGFYWSSTNNPYSKAFALFCSRSERGGYWYDCENEQSVRLVKN